MYRVDRPSNTRLTLLWLETAKKGQTKTTTLSPMEKWWITNTGKNKSPSYGYKKEIIHWRKV